MLLAFSTALVFFLIGAGFAVFNLFISRLIQPRHSTEEKLATYECGEMPVGQSWIQFNNRFYVIALIFLIFDVEIAFLFPWAVVFKELGMFAFVEMAIFVLILLVGLAYVRRHDGPRNDMECGLTRNRQAHEYIEQVLRQIHLGLSVHHPVGF